VQRLDVARPDDTRLAVQVTGPADGPALLLLPGQANSHHWWDGLRDDFDDRFRCVTFDYRGTGATRATESLDTPWSTPSFAEDAVAVLDHLGLDEVAVYGTSMGGRVAQVLAGHHPGRVRALALACTSPGGPHAHERGIDARRTLADPDPRARTRALLDLMYTPAWHAQGVRSHLLGDPTMSPTATRLHLRVSARHDAWDLLPAITARTLVLHATDDLMSPVANAGLIASRIPGAQLAELGGRHGFFDEFRDEVSPRVAAFLAD
jgi:pimeloyl-ACP methyl ester carboxylesterase